MDNPTYRDAHETGSSTKKAEIAAYEPKNSLLVAIPIDENVDQVRESAKPHAVWYAI